MRKRILVGEGGGRSSTNLFRVVGLGLLPGGIFCAFLAVLLLSGEFEDFVANTSFFGMDLLPVSVTRFHKLVQIWGGFSFAMGSAVLLMSIATLILGLIFVTRDGNRRSIVLGGYAALVIQTALLAIVFYWPVFIVFLLTATALYLGTEWEGGSSDTVSLGPRYDGPIVEEDENRMMLSEPEDEPVKADDEEDNPEADDQDEPVEQDSRLPDKVLADDHSRSAAEEVDDSVSAVEKPSRFGRFFSRRRTKREKRSRRSRSDTRHEKRSWRSRSDARREKLSPASDRDQLAAELAKLRKEMSQLKRGAIPVMVKPYKPAKTKLLKSLDVLLGLIVIAACLVAVIAVIR